MNETRICPVCGAEMDAEERGHWDRRTYDCEGDYVVDEIRWTCPECGDALTEEIEHGKPIEEDTYYHKKYV